MKRTMFSIVIAIIAIVALAASTSSISPTNAEQQKTDRSAIFLAIGFLVILGDLYLVSLVDKTWRKRNPDHVRMTHNNPFNDQTTVRKPPPSPTAKP